VLDVFWRRHLSGPLEVLRVLPQVLESVDYDEFGTSMYPNDYTYSSVAFISGHVWGEQNSVMDP